MSELRDVNPEIKTFLEVEDQGDGTTMITVVGGHSVMVNKQDVLDALGIKFKVPDLFMAVEYDSTQDSYVACCSGTLYTSSGEAVREYKDWGRCGVPTIARRHEGMWYIGDVCHERLVI